MSYYHGGLAGTPSYLRTSANPTLEEAILAMAGAADYYRGALANFSRFVSTGSDDQIKKVKINLYQALRQVREGMAHWCSVLAPLIGTSKAAVYDEIAEGLMSLGYDITIDDALENEVRAGTASVLSERLAANMANSGVVPDATFIAETVSRAMNAVVEEQPMLDRAAVEAVTTVESSISPVLVEQASLSTETNKPALFAGAALAAAWLIGLI